MKLFHRLNQRQKECLVFLAVIGFCLLAPLSVPRGTLFQESILSGPRPLTAAQKEARRKADNKARLQKLHPWMRPKVAAILRDLESKGYRPLIDSQVHRTPAQQAALKARGVSKVSYSFHTVTGPHNRPESLAADITDVRWGWNSGRPFWLMLASSAQSHGLSTGITWGLTASQRGAVGRAILLRTWNAKVPLGWDVAHCQPLSGTITLSAAKAGKRPT